MPTKIEWCDETINPIRTADGGYHCTKVSEGCQNCYAVPMNNRFGNKKPFNSTPAEFVLNQKQLDKPFHWRNPRKIFVQSMGDLFHEDVPFELIDTVFAVMASCADHTFLLLTKRPMRMLEYMQRVSQGGPVAAAQYTEDMMNFHRQHIEGYAEGWTPPPPPEPEVRFIYTSAVKQEAADPEWKSIFYNRTCHWRKWPLSNVWMGVTTENQAQYDDRTELLLQIPAAKRFVSVEPMLSPVDIKKYLGIISGCKIHCPNTKDTCRNHSWECREAHDDKPGLDWIICGGESGPGARPMHPDWARGLRDQCQAAGVPFYFKQWGEYCSWGQMPPQTYTEWGIWKDKHHGDDFYSPDEPIWKVGKKKSGRLLDGRTWEEFPGVAL